MFRVGPTLHVRQFEGRGHSLTVDSGWREVGEAVLEWLKAHGV